MVFRIIAIIGTFCLVTFQSFNLIGQTPAHFIYDTSNGLVSDEVYDVEIAQNGLIWITTDRGLQSFDGYAFTNYSTSDGMMDNVNFEIFEDDSGKLWFNGFNGEITYFDNGKFYRYEKMDEVISFLKKYAVLIPAHVILTDSFLVVSSEGSKNKRFVKFGDHHTQVIEDTEIILREGEEFEFIRFGEWTFSYHEKKNDNTSKFYSKAIKTCFGQSIIVNEYSVLIEQNRSQKVLKFDSRLEYVNNEEEHIIWICTNDGLYSIDRQNNNKIDKFFEGYGITSIQRDSEGNYWVSSIESGLFLVPTFKLFNLDAGSDFNRTKMLSLGILGDYLLFGTSDGRLYSVDSLHQLDQKVRTKSRVQQIIILDGPNDNELYWNLGKFVLSDKEIGILAEPIKYKYYKYGDHYLTMNTKWFSIMDENKEFCLLPKDFNYPMNHKVNSFLIQDDYFLIGSFSGLFLIEGLNYKEVREVLHNHQSIGRISSILKNNRKEVLVLSMKNGVFFYDSGSLRQLEGINESIFINSGVFINDDLWLATNSGLFFYELDYNEKSSNPEIVSFKKYSYIDGLPSNYINDLKVWNDDLWLATNKGLCYLDIVGENYVPDSIPLNINFVRSSDSLDIRKGQKLRYDQNKITIDYSGVSMKKEIIDPFYRYRLTKNQSNSNWKTTNSTTLQFEDLKPGYYNFELLARNSVGEWNNNPKQYDFFIMPHFTDRLWFRLIFFFLILSGIALYVWWLLRISRRRYEIKQKLKQAELDARESELSLLRNQMNPHFIFNSLNAIQNLIFKKDDIGANRYLTTFGKLIRKTLHNTKKQYITLKEEIVFTSDYLVLEAYRFPDKFSCQVIYDENLILENIMVPPLLFQPIVENAVLHAFKGIDYKGEITIRIKDVNDKLYQVEIEDNGVGYGNAKFRKNHKSVALSLIRDRLELINVSLGREDAEMKIESEKGTRITFVLPKSTK